MGRKLESKTVSLGTETSYKAVREDESAQQDEVRGSSLKVNGEVAQLEFAFLSGETCMSDACANRSAFIGNVESDHAGVSRGHSTVSALAGRFEPKRITATPGLAWSVTNPTGGAEKVDTGGKHGGAQCDLFEHVLSRENMLCAWKRVKANQGAAGMDDMSLEAFPEFARQHWDRIRSALMKGSYRPAAVRRVMIPKATGGERPLGIPTVLDRVIQQALAQQIGPLFEKSFHPKSFGFRPQRGARDALGEMESAYQEGYRFAVDCDLKSFFDEVNHDLLMARLREKVEDERVTRLIGRYLRAGTLLPDGSRVPAIKGVPQGGPLSPLLSNIMLNDLDWELSHRQLRFVRYADDFLIFVKSKRAAQRVLQSVTRFVEGSLKLIVNQSKSQATRLVECTFLGFGLSRGKLRWSPVAVTRFKQRIREITARSSGRSMKSRITELRSYIIGWLHYFGHSRTYDDLLELDSWMRRRVRLCYWKDWKRPRTRGKKLLSLGADPETVHWVTRSRKGYWRMSSNRIVQQALSNQWLWDQGVPHMRQQWIKLHYGSGPS